MIVGIHFGYGVTALAPVQPITASFMPPLAFLAFRGLTQEEGKARIWIHLCAPAAVSFAVLFVRPLVDPLLLLVFVVYGAALWRLTRKAGEEIMAEATLERMRPAFRAVRLTSALMFFFALSDAAIAIYAGFAGSAFVPSVVAAMNILALAASLAFYVAPVAAVRPVSVEQVPDGASEVIVEKVRDTLNHADLFRDENLSLAKIARKAGIPARDLSSAINRATGLNVSQFVNNRRVEEACRLLDEKRQSATAIMLEVGFSTKSNFNREFRRATGMSPRQWRGRSGKSVEPGVADVESAAQTQQLGNDMPP